MKNVKGFVAYVILIIAMIITLTACKKEVVINEKTGQTLYGGVVKESVDSNINKIGDIETETGIYLITVENIQYLYIYSANGPVIIKHRDLSESMCWEESKKLK